MPIRQQGISLRIGVQYEDGPARIMLSSKAGGIFARARRLGLTEPGS